MIRLSKASVDEEELNAVKEVLDLCFFGLGSIVKDFEELIAGYLGIGNFIAVNTGTAALHLALDALGIGPGDEVLVPSLTYVASYQAISATGAKPVSCDVREDDLLLDPEDAEARITNKTKCVMPVHYTGNPCEMTVIHEMAQKYHLRVVEDAAQALGSIYDGRKIGSFGDVVCFSFDGVKNITTGEGGGISCFDPEVEERIVKKRVLGVDKDTELRYRDSRSWDFDVEMQGWRYHMSNIFAGIGIAQFNKLEYFISRRKEICKEYLKELSELPGIRLLDIDYNFVAPHIFVIRVKDGRREQLTEHLKSDGIATGIHYMPNHFLAFYREDELELPICEKVSREILTLPLHVDLSDDDVKKVITSIRNFFLHK